MPGQSSSPSARAPAAEPIARSSGTGMTLRRSSWRRAMPSSSRSSSSGSIRTFESEPMQSGIPRSRTRATGRKPSPRFASVVGQTQIARAGLGEEVELALVGVRGVDDRRPRPEAAGLGQELDRPEAVLGEAFLDLARLLVGVDVEDEALALGVARRSPRASRRGQARTEWGATPTARPAARSSSTWLEVLGDRRPAGSGRARRGRRPRAGGRARFPPPAAASTAAFASAKPT